MERKEQIAFVNDLANRIRAEVAAKINDGKIPAEWDGFELRWYLAERFAEATLHTCRVKFTAASNYRQRFRDYTNHVLVTNL